MTIRWRMAGATDLGRVRPGNEDRFEFDAEAGIAVVADGMGGHEGGEVASRLAVETVVRTFRREIEGGAVEPDLSRLVREAQLRLADAARSDPHYGAMGTTIVLAHLRSEGRLRYAHLGDSRIYRLRDGALVQLTRDHTVLERERAAGRKDLDDDAHPYAHVLVRSLMAAAWMEPDVETTDLRAGDRLLLASDGLTGLVGSTDITEILASSDDLEAVSASLIQQANQAGGHDNITSVVVAVE